MGIKKQKIEIQKKERLGEINVSNEGYDMKIIEYNGVRDITIEFQDEYKTIIKNREYKEFIKGKIKNPYHKSVFGIGYIGQGKYKVSVNGKHTEAYVCWKNMLRRCYDPYHINYKQPSYKDCIVCKEWHCFQIFAEWYYKNYYECNNEKIHLDKDILIKGNKIYSPETCILVPERINLLFIKSNSIRGKYPIGVHWDKEVNKFKSKCSILDKNGNQKSKFLGYYDTSEEAFFSYKEFKEDYIKQVAEEYKSLIPKELYDALYRYEIEIDD